MTKPIKIETIDGLDYVSVADAKRIFGAKSASDLRALGGATLTIGTRTLWSLGWVINQVKRIGTSEKFHPDLGWIGEYEANVRSARGKAQLHAAPLAASSEKRPAGSDSEYLDKLRHLLPPPDNVPCSDVDWDAVERVVGLTYPPSFKSFVSVYGALQWFDWLQPLVPFENMTPDDFRSYLEGVVRDNFEAVVRDSSGKLLQIPMFGTPGGWLPFMTGSDGEVYAWNTVGAPETWSVVCVLNRTASVLPPLSLPEMLAGWLLGEPAMEQLWGTVDEFRTHSANRLTMLR